MHLSLTLIGIYVGIVVAAVITVRTKFHAPVNMAVKGTILLVVASTIGGLIGGFSGLARHSTSPILNVMPYVIAGTTEEIGRCIALYRYAGRQRPLPDILMFGIGFGGGEVLWRVVTLLLLMWSGKAQAAQPLEAFYVGIACIEIFVFHVCLTLIVYTFMRTVRRALIPVVAGTAIVYHVGLNFFAVLATLTQHSFVYGIAIWAVASAFHIPLALQTMRRSPVAVAR